MTKDITAEHVLNDLRYLTLLARSFPTVADASTEIINLEAILNLPKGTEHFLSDIHGEHQAFNHVLKNASGAIKRKVNEIFSNTLRDFEKKELCTLIYYPEQKLELIRQREKDLDDWYLITLNQLVRVCRNVSSKYTRSKVRKALPKEFSYIIQELLHESSDEPNKSAYVDQIINTIISTGRANDFIIAMCNLIQRLTIDLLHIIGDIYDRGPGAHIIMDTLCNYHNFDIQWGNHDILWMGAAAGNAGSIANVIRMCMRYGNLATLEDGYGINLLPLATFAMEVYGNDPCELFIPRTNASDATFDEKTTQLIARMHKAITIIQFKLEGEIIRRRPEFGMDDRLLLHHIDLHRGTIRIEGKEYELKDKNWPTLNAKDPYALSIEEEELMRRIKHSFECSEKLKKHMRCLFTHGSMYQVCNSNLLFHASVPMNPDGTLSPASAPKKRAKPAPGSEPKAPVKTKKEIIPHTVVSAPEKDTVGDLIEQLHKEPEPLPEEQPEEKAETPEKTDGKKSIIPKTIVSAPVQQWYKTNKALYNAEVAAMRKEFNDPNMQPHFMSDGRMYWLVKTRPNLGRGFNTMTYTMKLVYDPDHPKVRYSSSVKPYLVSPTLGELQKIVNMLPHIPLDADGKKLIPHTLTDNRGERYICSSDVADVHAEDTCTTSAVTSFRFAYRWLMVFELAIRKPEAWKDFQAHGKI